MEPYSSQTPRLFAGFIVAHATAVSSGIPISFTTVLIQSIRFVAEPAIAPSDIKVASFPTTFTSKPPLYFESAAGKLKIIENGVALDYSEEEATKVLSEKAVTAVADIKMGEASASAWGCDLTYDYVKINADYRS